MEHNPICDMYFVTTGQWKEDKNIVAVIQEGVKHMESTNLFSEAKFYPIDADYLKNIYRALRKKLVKEVNFEKHTILPKIDKVRTAYIGILPSSEYLKLICDAEGNLQRSLFYDNVRDYQGNNSVNQEIRETIETPELSDKFALLNNGITIVARSVNQTGTTFKIGDFQIVNGCQTSHVLYFNKESLSGEMYIPVKLIVTDDNETTNRIIQATNRQTEVKLEAFESLSDFHKQLEEFYATFDKETGKRLYYERRSKQYEYQPNVNKNQIISIATQAKCFLAMFLNGPHSTHRYYGNILKFNRNQIFNESHKMFPYYLSGFALHRLERLFYQKKIENRYRLFRYHLLMIFRLQNETAAIPPLNSQKIDQYCQELAEILWDEKAALKAFQKAVQILDSAFSQSNYSRVEAERRKVFTESIEELVRQSNKSPHVGLTATVTRETGTVTEFSNIRGYGFISGDDGRNLFVHYSQIRGSGFRGLDIGARVSYVVVKTQKGVQAKDVILQDDKRAPSPQNN